MKSKLKLKVFPTAKDASLHVAKILLHDLKNNPRIKLGLATGSTPEELYKLLIEDHQTNKTSYAQVLAFNLDEYYQLDPKNAQSYHYFMSEKLFKGVNFKLENSFFPDLKSNYDDLIAKHGGIDFQILGIGSNGHIGFNEPGTSKDSETRLVDLAPSTIVDNARNFAKKEDVPTKAISMGLKSIMRAQKIVLLAFGKNKAAAVAKLLEATKFDANLPASVLVEHPDVEVVLDEAAANLLK